MPTFCGIHEAHCSYIVKNAVFIDIGEESARISEEEIDKPDHFRFGGQRVDLIRRVGSTIERLFSGPYAIGDGGREIWSTLT